MNRSSFIIWEWLHQCANSVRAKSWSLIIKFNNEHCYIIEVNHEQTNLNQILPEENEIVQEVKLVEIDQMPVLKIPVFVNKDLVIEWSLFLDEKPIENYSSWRDQLLMFIRAEALYPSLYPSFIPYFLPFDDTVFEINKSLEKKKKLFFLNGQTGTGKKSFIRNHLLLNYQISLDFSGKKSVTYKKLQHKASDLNILIVPELALCEEEELVFVENLLENGDNTHIYLCSLYDPDVLHSRGMISSVLRDASIENRIIFPALHRRPSSASQAVRYYSLIKDVQLPKQIDESWFIKSRLKEGFNDVYKTLYTPLYRNTSISDLLAQGKDLRDIVASIEYEAIKFAQRIVGNSQLKIAKLLGISRGSLQHKLKKYDFPYHEWEE